MAFGRVTNATGIVEQGERWRSGGTCPAKQGRSDLVDEAGGARSEAWSVAVGGGDAVANVQPFSLGSELL